KTPPLPNATFGSFPAGCHYKDGTFVPEPTQADCPTTAPGTGAAFFFFHPKLITMHFWIWYPNPAGLFSSTNPLVAPFDGGGPLPCRRPGRPPRPPPPAPRPVAP